MYIYAYIYISGYPYAFRVSGMLRHRQVPLGAATVLHDATLV